MDVRLQKVLRRKDSFKVITRVETAKLAKAVNVVNDKDEVGESNKVKLLKPFLHKLPGLFNH